MIDYSESRLAKPVRKKRKNHSRRKKTSELRKMETELDALLSAYTVGEAGGICNWCEKGNRRLFSSHVLPKGSAGRLRYEPDNLMALCYGCHLGARGWHKDPMRARDWFDAKYPGRYQRLQIAARNSPKVDLKLLLTIWRAGS